MGAVLSDQTLNFSCFINDQTYWNKLDWALKKDTGVGVVQSITIPEARESFLCIRVPENPEVHENY